MHCCKHILVIFRVEYDFYYLFLRFINTVIDDSISWRTWCINLPPHIRSLYISPNTYNVKRVSCKHNTFWRYISSCLNIVVLLGFIFQLIVWKQYIGTPFVLVPGRSIKYSNQFGGKGRGRGYEYLWICGRYSKKREVKKLLVRWSYGWKILSSPLFLKIINEFNRTAITFGRACRNMQTHENNLHARPNFGQFLLINCRLEIPTGYVICKTTRE